MRVSERFCVRGGLGLATLIVGVLSSIAPTLWAGERQIVLRDHIGK